jgi:hypothetical protein
LIMCESRRSGAKIRDCICSGRLLIVEFVLKARDSRLVR